MHRNPASRNERGARPWRTALRSAPVSMVAVLLAWAALNVVFNSRYPADDLAWAAFTPSLDATAMLSILAFAAAFHRRIPLAGHAVLVAVLVLARLVRYGDAIEQRYFFRNFNWFIDLPLVPEAIRLLAVTTPGSKFALWVAAAFVGFVGACFGLYAGLRASERAFGHAWCRRLFGFGAVGLVVATLFMPQTPRQWGAFAPSVFVRVAEEVDFLLDVYGYRDERLAEIHRVERRLAGLPTNLAKLAGSDVYLFIIESYGHTVFASADHLAVVKPALERFHGRVGRAGFESVSSYLESPTYAGSSWLAHATLATGVTTENQFQYDLLFSTKGPTLATYFRDAGYRTVHALAGTTRPWPEGEFYRFEQKYYRWHFDYTGPPMGWGGLPDQYILDFIRRKELTADRRPLFLECALVASHAPWSVVPPVIDDWRSIGRGEIYERLPKRVFDVDFSSLERGKKPYLETIAYDFEVLGRFLERFVDPDSLVVILGDHQPAVQVSGRDQSWSVPIHVISGRSDHLGPFLRRGYTRGLVPRRPLPHPLMNEFLPSFLEDFSTRDGRGRG